MEKTKKISAAIQLIKETGFSYKPLPQIEDSSKLNSLLRFGIGFEFDIESENEKFVLNTNIEYKIEGYEESYLEFSNSIAFKVINLKDALKEEDGKIVEIDDELIISLVAVCIGTSRGLLAANTKGLDWANYPLPILDPKQVVKEMNVKSKE